MTDPYSFLANQLAQAAERQEARRGARGGARAWLSRRLNATAAAALLVLGGGAVAVAATGVLNGAPVKPEVPPSPVAGNGLPVTGGHPVALAAADPHGGLPWGLRVLHTTRGQVCVQVGRVLDGRLGELGVDSAFGDDGRFHVLAPEILPPGYGGATGDVECAAPGQTLIFEDTSADRSAVRLLPEEFREAPRNHKHHEIPPVRDLRALSFGLLGPHAVSITYRTLTGMRTIPVAGPDGAFLIVEPAGYVTSASDIGGSEGGEANANSVNVIFPLAHHPMVSAVTFRFGRRVCSQGAGAPVHRRCPRRRTIAPRRWFLPTRSLHAPVALALLPQSHAACDAAFLRYPCYKGQVKFTAPYAVTTAGTDYEIDALAQSCKVGGRPETAWELERDVRREELVRTDSLGLFVFTPSCAPHEAFRVSYLNPRGPSAHAPHESVILGTVSMSDATGPRPPG
jgi:hypothetical protein